MALDSMAEKVISSQNKTLEDTLSVLDASFPFIREHVPSLVPLLDGCAGQVLEQFKARIAELDYNKIKRLSEFVSNKSFLTEGDFRRVMKAGKVTSPEEVGSLLDMFFSEPQKGEDMEKTSPVGLLKIWIDQIITRKYRDSWDNDIVIKIALLPVFCPKFCATLKEEDLCAIEDHIKNVNK